MKAVILAGGLGTRLRPLTFSIPKPLVPVNGKPLLDLCIERLAHHSFHELIFCTGYLSDLIEAFVGDGSKWNIKPHFTKETKALGTAGPIGLIRNIFEANEDFLLLNGDVVTSLDFAAMMKHHKENKNDITVGYTNFTYTSPFGIISEKDGLLFEMKEKPSVDFQINCGIYIINSSMIKLIPQDQFFTAVDLAREGQKIGKRVGVYYIKEYWHGIENIRDLEKVASDLLT